MRKLKVSGLSKDLLWYLRDDAVRTMWKWE